MLATKLLRFDLLSINNLDSKWQFEFCGQSTKFFWCELVQNWCFTKDLKKINIESWRVVWSRFISKALIFPSFKRWIRFFRFSESFVGTFLFFVRNLLTLCPAFLLYFMNSCITYPQSFLRNQGVQQDFYEIYQISLILHYITIEKLIRTNYGIP